MNDMSIPPDRSLPSTPVPPAPTTPLTATLEAQEWNIVFTALSEAAMPMRISRPVHDKLLAQLQPR